jgi:hypothetical protein
MVIIALLTLVMAAPLAQSPAGFSGRWVGEDTRMGAGGEAVASAVDAHLLPRTPRTPATRELVIEERPDAVEVLRPETNSRLTLPLSGLAVTATDASGIVTTARALREGAALVIRREHQLRLPGGSEVVIEVVERHELLADGTLRVTTTSTSGTLVQTRQAIYRRAQ